MNKALAKLILIAFWGIIFQCQAVGAIQYAIPAAQASKVPLKTFCKKKLIQGQQEDYLVTTNQSEQKRQVEPLDPDYISQLVDVLIDSLLDETPSSGVHHYSSSHWLTGLQKANPNKAPPVLT